MLLKIASSRCDHLLWHGIFTRCFCLRNSACLTFICSRRHCIWCAVQNFCCCCCRKLNILNQYQNWCWYTFVFTMAAMQYVQIKCVKKTIGTCYKQNTIQMRLDHKPIATLWFIYFELLITQKHKHNTKIYAYLMFSVSFSFVYLKRIQVAILFTTRSIFFFRAPLQ